MQINLLFERSMDNAQITIQTDWSKTKDGRPGISVRQHCETVSAVAAVLLRKFPFVAKLSGLSESAICFLAASHDVGKVSLDFLQKCPAWVEQEGFAEKAVKEAWGKIYTRPHFGISQKSLDDFCRKEKVAVNGISAAVWSAAVGAHHGVIKDQPSSRPVRFYEVDRPLEENRKKLLRELWEECGRPQLCEANKDDPRIWLVSGLIILADWIGSDEDYFPVDQLLTRDEISERAERAVEDIGLGCPKIKKNLSFGDLFSGRTPYPLQSSAYDFVQPGGVHVIEAPMGMGKTEAALYAAYKLLESGLASGIYFALPTQATSNRMFLRFADFVKRISSEAPPASLLHANSWLQDDLKRLAVPESEGKRRDYSWFSGSRRALFAPFGVGTVDQALLSILPVRFFSLRRMALAGKAVILDEVHSYDRYTGDLIKVLCEELPKMGCTVIILSATLTDETRCRLLGRDAEADPDAEPPYPRLTGVLKDSLLAEADPETVPDKKVIVRNVNSEQAVGEVAEAVKKGALVLWICDTVGSAQETYLRLKACLPEGGDEPCIGLLHSRYPFYAREALESYWMERFSAKDRTGRGAVLVSTQVVEQSVDLDADLMVSELAPTDILLQRLGRLWRHSVEGRPVERPVLCLIDEETGVDELRKTDSSEAVRRALGKKAYVYSPYVLLKTLEVWSGRKEVAIPGEIRHLMALTYSEDDIPEAWESLSAEYMGEAMGKSDMALFNTNVWRMTLDDGTPQNLPSRLSERKEFTLGLVREWCEDGCKATVLENNLTADFSAEKNFGALKRLSRCTVRIPEKKLRLADRKMARALFHGVADGLLLVREDGSLAAGAGVAGLEDGMRWDPELGVVFN